MPLSENLQILIVYSSPEPADRLRLDKEHRAIDEVIRKHHLQPTSISRLHAAALLDVSREIETRKYDIVQFSCHGDSEGLFLESGRTGTKAKWELIANVLAQLQDNLTLVVLTACYSDNAERALLKITPFVVAINGEANDEAAIAFSEIFFDILFQTNSVEQAFQQTSITLEIRGLADKISPILIRRPYNNKSTVQVYFGKQPSDSVIIDVSEIEEQISKIGITRHQFISLLTRKIRIHSFIFRSPRENAVLSIGPYFGVFSWKNANDVVVCHRIMQLKPGLIQRDCLGWIRLLVIYNDICSERYRTIAHPAAEENRNLLKTAISSVSNCFYSCLCANDVSESASALTPDQYSVTVSIVKVHLERAIQRFDCKDYPEVIVSLESSISSIHDLLNVLTDEVIIKT